MAQPLSPGDLAPWFRAPTLDGNQKFAFDSAGGRYILLFFAGSVGREPIAEAMRRLASWRSLFDDHRAAFFGVTSDPSDVAEGRIAKELPGIRWFLDYPRGIARLYGAADETDLYRPHWLLLDPMLRVVSRATPDQGEQVLRQLAELLERPVEEGNAPVLIVPRVFEPEMCRRLIALYEGDGGQRSGFMRDVDGVTVGLHDDSFKRRRDYYIDNQTELRAEINACFVRALVPQIERTFQFRVTRIERYIVACYDGESGGFFRAHRDNTTPGTAHRRFACSINLNAEEYEGGDLCFPEFGSRRYRAPTGGAVVFSCSLLHEAMPVTKGTRYAYLPFFYDDAAARQREEVARTERVDSEHSHYRA
jgi:predicted 2-oxoglutarate/Fe(II)-dependent dioxygenase YbiX/peroxiredoxin